jgi:hypothetical protein
LRKSGNLSDPVIGGDDDWRLLKSKMMRLGRRSAVLDLGISAKDALSEALLDAEKRIQC